MDRQTTNESCERFTVYLDGLASVIRPSNRADPLRDYCKGLLLPAARKSVEPMADMALLASRSCRIGKLLLQRHSWKPPRFTPHSRVR